MIHDRPPGICAMKSIARFYVWWPGLDSDIERYVRNCSGCRENQPRPPEVPLFSWNMPSEPWARLHDDFAGPFKNLLCNTDRSSRNHLLMNSKKC
ncbi:hypothetical protein M513_07801 [Trichuris suis]|nr:hypothetical protein M513_07801 [Trichuris suis]